MQVRVSYLEVYEERVYDLLDGCNRDKPMKEWAAVTFMADREGNQVLKGPTTQDVNNEGENSKERTHQMIVCYYRLKVVQ